MSDQYWEKAVEHTEQLMSVIGNATVPDGTTDEEKEISTTAVELLSSMWEESAKLMGALHGEEINEDDDE